MNSGRIFTEARSGEVNILPLFTEIEKNNCFSIYTVSEHFQKETIKNRFRNTGEKLVYTRHFVFDWLTHYSLGKG